jgi:multiple sugar transport system substrate-binding protein
MNNQFTRGQMNRRNFMRLAGMSAVGGMLAACAPGTPAQPAPDDAADVAGAPAQQQVEIEFMTQAGELSEAEIEQFQEKYPGITISRLDVDATRYMAMLAAGTPPDVLRLQAPQFPLLLARRVPLNLQPYVDVSDNISVEDLAPANNYYRSGGGALEIGSGDVYGMVKDWSPDLTLWANLDLIEEAGLTEPSLTEPMTYEEVYAYGEEILTFDGDRVAVRGFDYGAAWIERYWMVWLDGIGESLFTDDFTQIDLVQNDPAREAVRYHFDLAAERISSSTISPSPNWPGLDFCEGALGIVQYGFWFSGGVPLWGNEDILEKMETGRIVMLPSPTWKGVRRGPTITATGAIISAASEHHDEAYRVFEWYMAEEPALDRAASGWGVPALVSMYDLIPKDGIYREQVWSVLEDELNYAEEALRFNPYLQGGEPGVAGSLYTQFSEQALRGEISFDDMLARIESETNLAIQDGIDSIG